MTTAAARPYAGLRESSALHRNVEGTVRRSTLIVPNHVDRFVAKARRSGADAVMLDLEDGVAPDSKDEARGKLKANLAAIRDDVKTILVRVNNEDFETRVSDMILAMEAGADGIFLPKTETRDDIVQCDAIMSTMERRLGKALGSTELAITLETPTGILNIREICSNPGTGRIQTVAFGSEDIALELGIVATEEGTERMVGNALVVLGGAAYGMQPLGLLGDLTNFHDLAVLEAAARRSYAFGFMGCYCIHPSQVPVLNRGFSPSEDEIGFARAVLRKAESTSAQAAQIGGKMIAASAFRRSERLMRRLDSIAAHET